MKRVFKFHCSSCKGKDILSRNEIPSCSSCKRSSRKGHHEQVQVLLLLRRYTNTQNAQNTAHVNSYAMWNASSLGAGLVLERLYVPWLFARECRSTSCISISSISHILPLARYPLNTYPHQDVSIQLLVLSMRLNHYGFVCLWLVQKVEEEGNKLYWALQTRQVIAMGLTSLPLHLPLKCRGAFALKSISLQLAPILLYLLPGLSVRLRRKWEEYTCLSIAICHFKMVDWRCCVRGLKVDRVPPWRRQMFLIGKQLWVVLSPRSSFRALDDPSVAGVNTETILEFKGKKKPEPGAHKQVKNSKQAVDLITTIVRGSFLQIQWNAGGTLVEWLVGLKCCAPCCSL